MTEVTNEDINVSTWKIPSPLGIIGSHAEGEFNGMTASWITQVSMEPALIGVGIASKFSVFVLLAPFLTAHIVFALQEIIRSPSKNTKLSKIVFGKTSSRLNSRTVLLYSTFTCTKSVCKNYLDISLRSSTTKHFCLPI